MTSRILGLIGVGLLASSTLAEAALITGHWHFTASGFTAGAPVDPVTGTVTYRFDNSATFLNQPLGALVNGVVLDATISGNIPGGPGTLVMTYFLDTVTPGGVRVMDVLAIGRAPATLVAGGTNDWRFGVTDVSTNPVFREFVYGVESIPAVTFITTTGSLTAVPEPGTLTLLSLGLAGLASRKRRRT